MNRKLFYLLKIIFSVFLVVNLAGCKSDYIIDNPYENVDWANFGRYKADLHAHTSRSDGYFSPHVVVDLYHNQGYHIFAIATFSPKVFSKGIFTIRLGYPEQDNWKVIENIETTVTRDQNELLVAF